MFQKKHTPYRHNSLVISFERTCIATLFSVSRPNTLLGHLQRADPFNQRASERVCADRKMGENAPQRANATGQTRSGRPIPGPNVGEIWVSPDSRGRLRAPPHVLPWPTWQQDDQKLKHLQRFAPRASSIDAVCAW
jgi:hypothetical protein